MERYVADERPVRTIVRAVADATGTDPNELPPLAECVDVEAVSRLLAGGTDGHGNRDDRNDPDVTIAFEYANCDVRATSTRVTVEPK